MRSLSEFMAGSKALDSPADGNRISWIGSRRLGHTRGRVHRKPTIGDREIENRPQHA